MKVASLPNGHVIGFPDEAEDPHMDAAVQGYMAARGDIPPPVDPVMQMLSALQQGFTAALAQQAHSLQAQIAEMQQQGAQREQMFIQQIHEMRQRDEHNTRQISAALTAPKRIQYDEGGRPVGLIVGN